MPTTCVRVRTVLALAWDPCASHHAGGPRVTPPPALSGKVSPTTQAAYWAYHSGRTLFFMVQGGASLLVRRWRPGPPSPRTPLRGLLPLIDSSLGRPNSGRPS